MADYEFPTAFSSWDAAEYAAIDRVVKSGRFTMGAEVEAFETELAAYHGRKHCIMVNSGSSANLVSVAALLELGLLEKGGEPIEIPAIAWSTTYSPFMQLGVKFSIGDVDDSWNAKPRHRPSRAYSVGCSILGNPSAAIQDTTCILNDDCESLGASFGSRTTGSYGFVATESFFYSHQIGAIEGGAILTNDDECATMCRMLRAHGWTRDTCKPKRFDDEYSFAVAGFNVRPVEIHAAVAREQLKKLPDLIDRRRTNYYYWVNAAKEAALSIRHPMINGFMSPFGLHFTIDDRNVGFNCNEESLREKLVRALRYGGIDCRLPTGGYYCAHSYASGFTRGAPHYIAERVHRRGLFLGCAPFPIEDKIDKAVKIMKEVL